jgi:hypothetical protein
MKALVVALLLTLCVVVAACGVACGDQDAEQLETRIAELEREVDLLTRQLEHLWLPKQFWQTEDGLSRWARFY